MGEGVGEWRMDGMGWMGLGGEGNKAREQERSSRSTVGCVDEWAEAGWRAGWRTGVG